MEGKLRDKEIRYLLDHLSPMYSGADLSEFLVHEDSDAKDEAPVFLVPASGASLSPAEVIRINDIPVLFPCSSEAEWYRVEENSIRFNHDILKSAFFLLSGYQEQKSDEGDEYGRYPWEASVQHQLGITGIPVVNYYFEQILEAFELFCRKNGLDFKKLERDNPLLFLSHDVDRIKKYSFRNMVYVGLQLPGIISSENKLARRFRNVLDYSLGFLLQKKDPYWNFSRLMEQEKQLGISSSWYFLEKSGKKNSRYHFSDENISKLIVKLSSCGHEIGIHGTMESSENKEILAAEIRRLNLACEAPVEGGRQHFLKYGHPNTPSIHEQSGLLYDASLGFAGQIGFRNSYALPFRLYDFDREKARDVWQIPLNVMDVTLLNYMGLSPDSIVESVRPLLKEVARFKGVFALLWHNCSLDEEEYPGINDAYQNLLEEVLRSKFESRTGRDLLGDFVPGLKSGGA